MEEVTELLGYIYETEGTVVHGDARGRLLGFPTANVKVKSTVRLPRIGVYAVQIEVGGKWYVGMGSIGHNDTFGEGRDLTVEVYILDFHQDIYGEQVVVRWNHYLRDQVKFNGAEALIDQLKQDERDTADYFQQSEDKYEDSSRKTCRVSSCRAFNVSSVQGIKLDRKLASHRAFYRAFIKRKCRLYSGVVLSFRN